MYGFKGRGEVVDECNKRVKFLLGTNVKDSLTNDQLYDVYIQLGVSYENVWRTKDALDYFTTVKSLIEKNNDNGTWTTV